MRKLTQVIKRQRGVTFVEVLLVLAISTLMIAMALGGVNNRGRTQFDDGMNQVLNSLRQVQNEATNGQGSVSSGQELFGKEVAFNTSDPTTYKYFQLRRPYNSGGIAVFFNHFVEHEGNAQIRKFPSNVKLDKIEYTSPIPGDTPTGTVVFARAIPLNNAQDKVGSVALPYFFAQADIKTPLGKPGELVVSYGSAQDNVVTLTFVNPRSTNMKAKIVINCSSGTMEIVR